MKSLLIGLFLCSFSSFGQLKLYATTPDYVENGDLFGRIIQFLILNIVVRDIRTLNSMESIRTWDLLVGL